MRLRAAIVISLFLFFWISNVGYGQDSNKVYYKIFMQSPASGWDIKIHKGMFKEGEGFVIPEQELPNDWRADLSIYQNLYDVLAGGYFSIDYGAINKDLILEMYIRNLDPETGNYKTKGEDGDTLFSYFEIVIWELPDSTYSPDDDLSTFPDSSYFSVDTSYYFNEGKHARLVLPKTEKFLSFLDSIGIARDDSLSFAYLQNEDWDTTDTKTVKTDDWNGKGIEIIDKQDSIIFQAIHLSKVGGGRGRIHKERNTVSDINVIYSPDVLKDFKLEQNYPNPFNPSTTINYSIPTNNIGNSFITVRIKVFDILGREVRTLINKKQKAGKYEITFDATDLTSGVYIYTLQTSGYSVSRKMILMK